MKSWDKLRMCAASRRFANDEAGGQTHANDVGQDSVDEDSVDFVVGAELAGVEVVALGSELFGVVAPVGGCDGRSGDLL